MGSEPESIQHGAISSLAPSLARRRFGRPHARARDGHAGQRPHGLLHPDRGRRGLGPLRHCGDQQLRAPWPGGRQCRHGLRVGPHRHQGTLPDRRDRDGRLPSADGAGERALAGLCHLLLCGRAGRRRAVRAALRDGRQLVPRHGGARDRHRGGRAGGRAGRRAVALRLPHRAPRLARRDDRARHRHPGGAAPARRVHARRARVGHGARRRAGAPPSHPWWRFRC